MGDVPQGLKFQFKGSSYGSHSTSLRTCSEAVPLSKTEYFSCL